tara:strand:- start:989 stop:1228 length:240 start_codon:yes stop_codon:yes gene_type:complete
MIILPPLYIRFITIIAVGLISNHLLKHYSEVIVKPLFEMLPRCGKEKENRYLIWYRESRAIFVVIIIAFIFGFIALPDV